MLRHITIRLKRNTGINFGLNSDHDARRVNVEGFLAMEISSFRGLVLPQVESQYTRLYGVKIYGENSTGFELILS